MTRTSPMAGQDAMRMHKLRDSIRNKTKLTPRGIKIKILFV